MEKNTKKKIAGAAGVVAAGAAGAAVINSLNNGEGVIEAGDADVLQPVLEGDELPELVVEGGSAEIDGGTLADVNVFGSNTIGTESEAAIEEPVIASSYEETLDNDIETPVTASNTETPVVAQPQEEAAPEEELTFEEDFEDDIDSDNELLASNNTKGEEGGFISDLLDKADGLLHGGANDNADLSDFVNDADVSMF